MWEHQDSSPGPWACGLLAPHHQSWRLEASLSHTGTSLRHSNQGSDYKRKSKAQTRGVENQAVSGRLRPSGSLTGICAVGHDEHPEGGEVDVPLVSVRN